MPVELRMPKLGLTMESGRIVEWKKKEGERVSKGETLLVVETEKITNEIKSPIDGILARITANPGEEVPVGGLLAIIAATPEEYKSISGQEAAEKPIAPTGTRAEKAPPRDTSEGEKLVIRGVRSRVRATPAARRLAYKMGIDISAIKGTGPRGIVTTKDVEQAMRASSVQISMQPSGPGIEEKEGPELGVEYEVLEMPAMRARIAEKLFRSYTQAIHTTLHMEACIDKLLEIRQMLPDDKRPSITAFAVKAVALALAKHVYMNTGLVGGKLVRYKRVNVGVAVALEDGLIVPVIRDADKKSIGQIWRELQDLTVKAREGKLSVEDVEGATFSISNLGMYGVDSFTPIIYPGHAGILGIGRTRDSVKTDDKKGGFTTKKCLTLSLTFDHRVVDGAQAAVFLSNIKDFLENPLPGLLDL